jgi:hypothetical protein
MENETQQEEGIQGGQTSRLHQVTPLSKYLAMALFVILPFVGGWIGYTHAPEKVVEVERVVVKEIEVSNNCAEGFEATCSLEPEYRSSLSESFLNVQKMLDFTQIVWEENDAYREYDLLRYLPNLIHVEMGSYLNDTGCYRHECQSVTLIGDRYSHRHMIDADTSELYDIALLGDYLREQGFVFLYEIAKGGQFGEIYQKTEGEISQIVRIASKPINITSPEDDNYPYIDSNELRIFVSSPFSIR